MTIRPADERDLGSIAALYVRSHRSTYRGLLPEGYLSDLTPARGLEKWSAFLGRTGTRVWTACEGDRFLGFAAGMPDAELAQTWYLESLHVAEKARGKGIGTALLRAAALFAAEHGYRSMSICVIRGNDRARKLYTGLGAGHYKDFEDCFDGWKTDSEKLLWEKLPFPEGSGPSSARNG